jgi:hypothetical protein
MRIPVRRALRLAVLGGRRHDRRPASLTVRRPLCGPVPGSLHEAVLAWSREVRQAGELADRGKVTSMARPPPGRGRAVMPAA